MSTGRLIAVVGASGVGKDSVISGVIEAAPSIRKVRRIITRPAEPDGEDHSEATREAFNTMVSQRAFCLHWAAHGYSYGIPASVLTQISEGEQCLANLSRSVLTTAADLFPSMLVLNITVKSATLAQRLAQRGRENHAQITSRLERVVSPISTELNVNDISNDGSLESTVATALDVLGLASVTQSMSITHDST